MFPLTHVSFGIFMLFLIQADLDVDISVHKGIYVQTLGIIKLWETVDTF